MKKTNGVKKIIMESSEVKHMEPSKNKRPNILILYSDQHSARTLGCYGNKQVKTPNLDQLAKDGIKMNHAYTQNPICTPSRMCMLSGQYAHNFGYYGLMGEKPNLPNIFKHLKKEGYKTGVAGKIHTPAGWVSDECDYVGDGYGFETPVQPWNREQEEGCQGLKGDDYAIYLAQLNLYNKRDDKILQEWYEEHGHKKGQCVDGRFSRIPKEHSIESWSANCANRFMEQAVEEETPFCFWVTVPRPHQTYAPSKEFWDMYEDIDIELPPNAHNDMKLRSQAAQKTQDNFKCSKDWMAFEPKDFESARKRVLRAYYACVSQMDDAMGQVLNKIDELGIRENTIIVYTTDHGEFAGEHGMIEKAPGIGFGCVTQIPMIFSWKGKLIEGEERESIIESVDILPTLCQLAGVKAPNWVDGKSAVSILEHDMKVKDYAVTENPNTKTIHSNRYKLTQYLPEFQGEDFGELFDMMEDPYELNNLYFQEEYQSIVQSLRYELYCWLVRSTRVKTANPTIPDYKSDKGISWDLGNWCDVYGEDGKIGEEFYKDLIQNGVRNYL